MQATKPAEPKLRRICYADQRRSGGAERDRTADLVIANDALSQLSYSPSPLAYMDKLRRQGKGLVGGHTILFSISACVVAVMA